MLLTTAYCDFFLINSIIFFPELHIPMLASIGISMEFFFFSFQNPSKLYT